MTEIKNGLAKLPLKVYNLVAVTAVTNFKVQGRWGMAQKDAALRIQLFGPLQVWRQGQPVTDWKQEKTKTLLKILASDPGEVFKRDQLIEWLWPESDPGKSQETLKNRVAELRRILEPTLKKGEASQFILTAHEGYRFNPDADCFIDLREFTRLYKAGQFAEQAGRWEQAEVTYEQALSLCEPGELLAEDRYEDWAIPRCEQWQEDYLDLLARLADGHARLGHCRRAIARCRQVLQKKPDHESVHRQLMLYYYVSGSLSEALGTYEEAVKIIARPSRETRELHHQIQAGHVPAVDGDKPTYPRPKPMGKIPYLLSPGSVPFAGRKEEYAQLVSHLEEARKRHGRFVLISGEAGVGKTRLIQELLAYARKRFNVRVFHGRGDELSPHLSYQPWAKALRDQLDGLQREDMHLVAPLWLAEVAKIVPELRVKMPDLPVNLELPPQQEQLRFFEGLTQFFLGIAEPKRAPKPLVLFLDDLCWADPASLDFLNYFLPRIEKQPIVILGAYRSEEVAEGHPLLRLVQTWGPKGLLHSLSLERLTVQEGIELLRSFPLKVQRPEMFCGRLYQETSGNPLFLVSTLQHFFEEGALCVKGKSWVTDIEDISANYKELMIPPTVKDLIKRRVERLGEPEQKLLRLASVIGRDFELSVLERAYEGDGERVAALANLTGSQLLIERRGRYEFSHDKIREIVYEELSAPLRELLHGRVLQGLEQLYGGRLEDWAGLLAQHAYQAGAWKKALEYSVQALKKAVKEHHHQEGLKLAELGLEAAQKLEAAGEDRAYVDGQQFELLAYRFEIYNLQGRRQEQQQALNKMRDLAEGEKGKQALVFQKKSDLYCRLRKYSEAEEAAKNALEFYREIGNKQGQGISLYHIGNVYWRLGQYEEALYYFQRDLKLRREIGDRLGQGHSLGNIGVIYGNLGRYEKALRYLQQDLEICQEIGDQLSQGVCLINIGNVYDIGGQHEKALRCRQQALQVCQEIGYLQLQGACLTNIGSVYWNLGQYEEALQHYQQALEICTKIEDRGGQGASLGNIGLAHTQLGQHKKALQYYQKALEICQDTENQWSQGYNLNNIGTAYRELGRYTEALQHHEQARAIFEELGARDMQLTCLSAKGMAYLELDEKDKALACSSRAIQMLENGQTCEFPQEIYFDHYRVLSAHNSGEKALNYLQKAYDEVMQRAEKIKDPQLRESFLKNVKIHHEIVTSWERYLKI